MNLRCLALLASLALPLTAWAQNVPAADVSLQPLYARLEAIRKEQLVLSGTIQSPKAGPQKKAQAKTEYQTLEAEKLRIQKEISQAQWMQRPGPANQGIDPTSPVPAPGQQ